MQTHWEEVYTHKAADTVSWYQEQATLSLQWIQRTGIALDDPIIDIGGGASRLVDGLLELGYGRITVLDISATALQVAQQRLGPQAAAVNWLQADVTQIQLPRHAYSLWHDRAVFHFLLKEEDRRRYVAAVQQAIRPGGHIIVATFATDGPTQCSGLNVARYNPDKLHGEFGADFELIGSSGEIHLTPSGGQQAFIYCYCRKLI